MVAVPRIVKAVYGPAGLGKVWHGLVRRGREWQGVTWLANCGSFPQQVNPTVRWGMVGKGSARQGSVYQSGGIANSQGQARHGWARQGLAGQGHFGAMVVVSANVMARHGVAWSGMLGQGSARLFSNLTGDSET
jgi:hypothetical protein